LTAENKMRTHRVGAARRERGRHGRADGRAITSWIRG
jgi:hypothetical protein